MAWFLRGLFSMLGRILLCLIFVVSAAMNKIPNFDETVEMMTDKGIPEPRVALIGAIVFLLLGSLLVITGYATRFGALLLLIFLCAATFFFHPIWVPTDAGGWTVDPESPNMKDFMKNLALAGAMLMLIGNGGGGWSFGRRRDEDDLYYD